MPPLDPTAAAALDTQAIRPAFFAYLDILGDPIRATTAGFNYPFAATGDPDLDGFTFSAVDPKFVNIGDVRNQEGGSDTVTCSLSGLILPDAELLATIANPANWRGRIARLWMQIRDENGTPQGVVAPYYTGYMVALDIKPSPKEQTIELRIENYLALLTRASNRSYLDQANFDPADQSARATISAANGAKRGPGGSVGAYRGGETSFNGYNGRMNVR